MRNTDIALLAACAACAGALSAVSAGCSTPSAAAPAADALDAGADATATSDRLALRVGEVAELAVTAGAAGVKLTTTGEAEEYALVLASTRYDSYATGAWSVTTDGAPEGASAAPVTGCSISPDAWRAVTVPTESAPSGAAVAKGTKKTVKISKESGAEDIEVEAIAVGKGAIVWKDVTPAHPATLDDAFVSEFLTDFDDLILPRERAIFGVESDLDGDGRISLVFSPVTKTSAVAFFSGCDLKNMAGCPSSNGGEYLYLTPPNAIDPPYNTPNAIKEILAHELAHLVHFNRKVLRNGAAAPSDSGYMNEGLGAFAQDAVGRQSGNLYVAKAGLEQIAEMSLGDVFVDDTPYDMGRDGAMRGGAYLFVRWLYDRAGGDAAKADGTIEGKGGPAFLRAVLEAPESVAGALPVRTASTLGDLGVDFFTALVMTNRDAIGGSAPLNPCFSYLPVETDPVTGKPRGADVYAAFHGSKMDGPATTRAKSGKLLSGGVTYAIVAAPAGQTELDLGVTIDAAVRPRVRIGRIR